MSPGLIPGVCGFTTSADGGCTFYLTGTKDNYEGSELVQKGLNSDHSARYTGSICFLRAKNQVEIKLSREGRPFEFNGRYHYYTEYNDALSP